MQDKITTIPSDGGLQPHQASEVGYPVGLYHIDFDDLFLHIIRWNWHQEIEIIVIEEGEADFFSDDIQLRLTKGQAIIINYNVIHALHLCEETKHCKLYSLKFHPSFLFGYGNTMMTTKYLVPVFTSTAMKVILLGDDTEWHGIARRLIDEIIRENVECAFGYELTTKAHLCTLWRLLIEQTIPQKIETHKSSVPSTDEYRIKEAIRYIENHYGEPMTLNDLANSLHISKSECCRCFKRTLQLTPFEYLMKYRIFQAASKISSEDADFHSISDLAFQVGFNNASYFNKVFKQYLNCTPTEYKKLVQMNPLQKMTPATSLYAETFPQYRGES